MKVRMGIWMPTATVLCIECHGPEFPHGTFNEEEWTDMIQPTPLGEDKDLTYCDRCCEVVQVYENVAYEHNLIGRLQSFGIAAKMIQTGSMKSAGEILLRDGGYYIVTFNEEGTYKWWIMLYDANGEPNDFDPNIAETTEELFTFLTSQKGLERL